jgi:transcriptional regulator
MGGEQNVVQGTLSLMILKTLETMGAQHGLGIARRIEQIGGSRMTLNYGTVYPMLLKLEQEGAIAGDWGVSDNNRRAKFYRLTTAGRRRLKEDTASWNRLAGAMTAALQTRPGEV